MPAQRAKLLSEQVAHLLPAFFRPLARRSAAFYVDCLERLDFASAPKGGELDRQEVAQIVAETLTDHPNVQWEDDENQSQDARTAASFLLRQMEEAGWIRKRDISIRDRRILIDPSALKLLHLLRSMSSVEQDPRAFTDTLRGIYQLINTGAFDASNTPDKICSSLYDLIDRSKTAFLQLTSVEGKVKQYMDMQRAAATAKENLDIVFTKFAEGDHQTCYDALYRTGALADLTEARSRINGVLNDNSVKSLIAEGIAQRESVSMEVAMDRTEVLLEELHSRLSLIRDNADLIDKRISEFNDLSNQRYRYLTENGGQWANIVRTAFEHLNTELREMRFSDLGDNDLPALRIPNVRLYFGTSALRCPRKLHQTGEYAELEQRNLKAEHFDWRSLQLIALRSITPERARKLIEKLLPAPGAEITTDHFRSVNEDDFLDLVSVLVHSSARRVRWKVEHVFPTDLPEVEKEYDVHNGYRIPRLKIRRTR